MKLSDFLDSDKVKDKPFLTVLGHPVSHSLSPFIHQKSIDYYGLHAAYYAVDCHESEYHLIKKLIRHPNFKGANVTIPLKKLMAQYVDTIDESASHVGAINTLVRYDDFNDSNLGVRQAITGFNTDVYGFLYPLSDHIANSSAIVLGTGGASKAVQYALSSIGYDTIYVVSRTPQTIPEQDDPPENTLINVIAYDDLDSVLPSASLIVNTTPVGMHPNMGHSPFPNKLLPFLKGKICYDIIYNPTTTAFLRDASAHGATVIGGLDMFVYQAARSFKIWFNKNLLIDESKRIILESLK